MFTSFLIRTVKACYRPVLGRYRPVLGWAQIKCADICSGEDIAARSWRHLLLVIIITVPPSLSRIFSEFSGFFVETGGGNGGGKRKFRDFPAKFPGNLSFENLTDFFAFFSRKNFRSVFQIHDGVMVQNPHSDFAFNKYIDKHFNHDFDHKLPKS